MSREWKEYELSDAVEMISDKVDVKDVNINEFISTENLLPNLGGIVRSSGLPKNGKVTSFKHGDVLFSNIRTYFRKVWQASFSGACSNDVIVFRGKDVENDFLYYVLASNSFIDYTTKTSKGTKMPRGDKNAIKKFIINLPPLPEQKAIAHILGTLDDKIELNRKMNATLEQMAQALFKSWFVDFDPVLDNAIALGNEIPEPLKKKAEKRKAVKNNWIKRAPELAEGFPSSFVFNEELQKWIPEGWEVKAFGELIVNIIGGDWGKEYPDEKHTEQVKIIRGTDIPSIKNCDLESAPTRYVELKKLKTRQLEVGDIVIEVSGGSPTQPTGRSILINKNILERLGNIVEPASFCRRFVPVSLEISSILSEQLTYAYNQGKMWEYQNQSTGIANFQTKYFLKTEKVLIPSKESLIKEFHQQVSTLRNKATSNENITLAKQRDVLLPQLISGKLRVSEEMMEKVLKMN